MLKFSTATMMTVISSSGSGTTFLIISEYIRQKGPLYAIARNPSHRKQISTSINKRFIRNRKESSSVNSAARPWLPFPNTK